MNIATNDTDLSRGVAKNGQELGRLNELKMLECIKTEGWIREHELHLITEMSKYTVGQVSRRLAHKKQIYRERIDGNAGYFLRLLAAGAERVGGKSGKDVGIPASWPHHALAIQTLHHLSHTLRCEFETEASMRHHTQSGKLPDGRLVSDSARYYFEQERTRKSGPALRKQTEVITKLAVAGTTCFVAYPYPPQICGGIDHETRQTNSLRHKWGNRDAPNIKLVRCYFDTLTEYQNMHVSRFEIISLPAMFKTAAFQKDQPGLTGQVMQFHWNMHEHLPDDEEPLRIDAVMRLGNEVCFEGTFVEATYKVTHHLKSDHGYYAECQDMEQNLPKFIQEQQKEIERRIEVGERMYAMQDGS